MFSLVSFTRFSPSGPASPDAGFWRCPRSGLFDPDPCTFSRSRPFEVPSEGVDRVARFLLAFLCRRGVGQHPGEELDELGEFGGFDFHCR